MADEQPNYPDSKETTDIGEPPNSKPGAKRRGKNKMRDCPDRSPSSSASNDILFCLTSLASRAGTRSVASLTPEQLARKRANDREAQVSLFIPHPLNIYRCGDVKTPVPRSPSQK